MMIYHLRKTFYSLKQFFHVWYKILYQFLQSLAIHQIKSNYSIFVSKNMFISVYLDDILIFCQNISRLKKIQEV